MASASVALRPSPALAPGGASDGAEEGVAGRVAVDDGPRTMDTPGNPSRAAPASAAIRSASTMATISARRSVRGASDVRHHGPRDGTGADAIRRRTSSGSEGAAGTTSSGARPRSRSPNDSSGIAERGIDRSSATAHLRRRVELREDRPSRPRARDSRDLTVPFGRPSISAASASDRSSRYRAPMTSRSSSRRSAERRSQLGPPLGRRAPPPRATAPRRPRAGPRRPGRARTPGVPPLVGGCAPRWRRSGGARARTATRRGTGARAA